MLTVHEFVAVRRLMHGWPIRELLGDFAAAKHFQIVGGRGSYWDGQSAEVTRKGIEGVIEGRPVMVTWSRLRAWLATMPVEVVAEARACRDEWAAICRARDAEWKPWKLPSWHEKYGTFGPLTKAAVVAVECDRREAALDARDRALTDRVFASADQPGDLFELLALDGAA